MKFKHIFLLSLVLSFSISVFSQASSEMKQMSGNPVFPGWYADPEGAVFGNEYWIYPTYSAPYEEQIFMDAFSSPDLVNWKKHSRVLSIENISWLKRALWAPSVIAANNKYYFFFGGNDVHNNELGGIGVAVAGNPAGPFKDAIGKPLIGDIVNGAQPIDQFVFKDDDGQYYMYYGGWGHCNMVKLSDDLLSIVPFEDGTLYKEVTPENYTEGPFMLKRNGKYYFMWSEGGWGGPDYCVAYAISDSPFGPFKRIGKILQQDPAVATGAGHHSLLKGPGEDEWYIVYHRRPLGETDINSRATCIDRMHFDKDGYIQPVKITFEGVKPSPFAKPRPATKKDATAAIDAFHSAFYNPEMKLYAISSDGKGRAAIWVQAIYWDMMMNAYKRTKDPKYRRLIEDIYQGGYEQYDKYNWNNKIEWFIYDDMMWWIVSLARAYEITNDPKYLAHAASGFYHVWKESYDPERGGLWWSFKHDAKMSCINYPTIIGAMELYNITKDPDYLEKAKAVYDWSRNVFFDAEKGCIADNMHYHFQRQNGMDINWTTQLYNQATFIGSAVMLYKETKEKKYLDDAILGADYVRNVMCSSIGLLPFKNGVEQGIYAAIFAQYIIRLIEDGNQPQYLDWLRFNIDAAWSYRDKKRNITFKNASMPCPEGVMESYDASGCPALMQVVPLR